MAQIKILKMKVNNFQYAPKLRKLGTENTFISTKIIQLIYMEGDMNYAS
jgi:hypothetical protein